MIVESKNLILNVNDSTVDLKLPWDINNRKLIQLQTGFYNRLAEPDPDWVLSKIADRLSPALKHLSEIIPKLNDYSTVVDIGAGNSLIDGIIEKLYADKEFKFKLVDGNDANPFDKNIISNISMHYRAVAYSTYNNWDYAKSLIEINNFNSDKFEFNSPSDQWDHNSCDLVMSIGSCGWHYPVSKYLTKIINALRPGGYLYLSPVLNIKDNIEQVTQVLGKPVFCEYISYNPKDHGSREVGRLDHVMKVVDPNRYACFAIWQK